MRYVLKQLVARESIAQALSDTNNLRVLKQAKVETALLGILGYLWGSKYKVLEAGQQYEAVQLSRRPTIGQIVQLIRLLDSDDHLSRHVLKSINEYPALRNEVLGHGYLYTGDLPDFCGTMDTIYDSITKCGFPIFSDECSLVRPVIYDSATYKGIRFSEPGSPSPWMKTNGDHLLVNQTYFAVNDTYTKCSPLVNVSVGGDVTIFNRIDDPLTGKIQVINVMTGARLVTFDPSFTAGTVEVGVNRFKGRNGTVFNDFKSNFKTFILVGDIKKRIFDFITKNKASACATVWGHGGMGKTAVVQEAIIELRSNDKKYFDYIVFVSAKDRMYNYETASVDQVVPMCSSMEDIMQVMKEVILGDPAALDPLESLLDNSFLLVVDDFETFKREERDRILDFIRAFDVSKNNKAVITTRANTVVGDEIRTSELDGKQTLDFLKGYMKEVFPGFLVPCAEMDAARDDILRISGGRPLFILQLAHLIPQIGLTAMTGKNISDQENAREFLFARIYENYLSPGLSRDIYCVISQLITGATLRNMVSKVAFVLNQEHNEDSFQQCMAELVKIRVIKIDEDGVFFEVYSHELFESMRLEYGKRDHVFKNRCESRLKLIAASSEKDVDGALLDQANSKRGICSQQEVTDAYRMLLNREACGREIRLGALLNLAAYLICDKGDRRGAIRVLQEYRESFGNDPRYVKMYATYLWQESTHSEKNDALMVLQQYVKGIETLASSLDLEIAGMFLTYWSNGFLTAWGELKESKFSLRPEAVRRRRASLMGNGNQIFGLAGKVFRAVVDMREEDLTPGARQNLLSGFNRAVEVMVRIGKHDPAIRYCEHFVNWSGNVDFYGKKRWIKSFQAK